MVLHVYYIRAAYYQSLQNCWPIVGMRISIKMGCHKPRFGPLHKALTFTFKTLN